MLDELEEADFYMQQGLHDEAEAIYRRVLATAPNHPRALHAPRRDRRGARRRAAADGAARASTGEAACARERGRSARRRCPTSTSTKRESSPEPHGVADEPDEVEIEVDFSDDEIGGDAEPVAAGAEMDDLASLDLDDAGLRRERGGRRLRHRGVRAPRGRSAAPAHASRRLAASEGEGDFDLAAALADAFDDDTGSGSRSALPAGDDGFAAVFQAFKKGVRETLSEGDHQAHYDLAIAYKEMGLYDDAIYELRTAMADPNRTAECLHLIGLCAIDSDQAPLAIEHLEQLLLLPNLAGDAALAGRFDLGRALEAVGDVDGARREWEAVAAQKPGFQNVRARLDGLGAPKPDDSAAAASSRSRT